MRVFVPGKRERELNASYDIHYNIRYIYIFMLYNNAQYLSWLYDTAVHEYECEKIKSHRCFEQALI